MKNGKIAGLVNSIVVWKLSTLVCRLHFPANHSENFVHNFSHLNGSLLTVSQIQVPILQLRKFKFQIAEVRNRILYFLYLVLF